MSLVTCASARGESPVSGETRVAILSSDAGPAAALTRHVVAVVGGGAHGIAAAGLAAGPGVDVEVAELIRANW